MIYFIRSGDTDEIKIGKAASVEKRLRGLQTNHARKLVVIRTIEGGLSEERWLHQHYADRRLSGEWFYYCQTMETIEPPKFAAGRLKSPERRIKDRISESFREALPPRKIHASEIAEKAGLSVSAVEAIRAGNVPNSYVGFIKYCRANPSFARGVAYMMLENADPDELKAAMLQRLNTPRKKIWFAPRYSEHLLTNPAPAPTPLYFKEPIAHGRTRKQNGLLQYLRRYTEENQGVAPTFEEMAAAVGLKSKSGIHRLLASLEERGAIRRIPHRQRAIEVLA